ncbi:MAG: sigma 54-interacting transcriptional regulator [Myxococcota bacterium]
MVGHDITATRGLAHEPFSHRVGRVVAVVRGPDAGRVVDVDDRPLEVGSDAACDLVLRDDTVSRRHLRLSPAPDGLSVEDLASRNGSFVQGARFERIWIGFGTEITIGRTGLKLLPREERIDTDPSTNARYGALRGQSEPMRRLFGLLDRVAERATTVLIEGETGTGKELVAEEIHRHSPRASKPFVVFDCGAVSHELIGSALFGHERGAFTGADAPRAGAFAAADGGTLFLDEVGELPLALQPALLRALDKGQIRRVGTDRYRAVDVRVVAATHRDLRQEVRDGRFREDLYFRLAVVRLRLPPLRDRPEDLELLVRHFLAELGEEVDLEAIMRPLKSHPLPGNVRELRNLVARAVALGPHDALDDLERPKNPGATRATGWGATPAPPLDGDDGTDTLSFREARDRVVGSFERRYLRRLMERHEGNLSAAAREAKVDRKQLRKLLQRHGIERES